MNESPYASPIMRSNYAALGDLVSQLEEDVAALEKRPMVVVAHALLVNAVADIDSYARVAGHTYRYDEEAYNAHILRYIRIKLFSARGPVDEAQRSARLDAGHRGGRRERRRTGRGRRRS